MKFLRPTALSLVFLMVFATNKVLADSITFISPLNHEGLTFSQPLTFSSDNTFVKPRTISFGSSSMQVSSSEVKTITLVTPPSSPTITLEKQLVIVLPTATPTPLIPPVTKPVIPTSNPSPTTIPPKISLPPSTPSPSPTVQVATSQSLSHGGLNADKLFSMVNAHRTSKGLPPFEKDERSCQLAISRAPEIEAEVASGTMHVGLKNRNLNYWNTENIISIRSEEEALNWWLGHGIHREAIESDKKYSCLACFGYSCAQEITNFQPK